MKNYKNSFKFSLPIAISLIVPLVISSLFIITTLYFDYSTYRKAFLESQNIEIDTVVQKSNSITDDIRKFLDVTLKRINAVNGDEERVQSILNSAETFGIRINLPSIKKLSYIKLKNPSSIITRFGSKGFDFTTLNNIKPSSDCLIISANENILIGKALNFEDSGKLEGLLEAEVEYQELKNNIGPFSMIELGEFKKDGVYSRGQQLFNIHKHQPKNFKKFVSINKSRYAIFLIFALLMLCLLAVGSVYFENKRKEKFKTKIKTLKQENLNLREEISLLNTKYLLKEQNFQCQQTSFNAYKNFQEKLHKRKSEHSNYIIRSLDVVLKSLNSSTIYISDEERNELIEECINAAQTISMNSMTSLKKGETGISDILSEIEKYYAEKIYKNKIGLSINGVDDFNVDVDSFFIEALLLCLIGKALFKVPRNGTVKINCGIINEQPFIEILDNGFSLGESTEKHLRKSLIHYLSDSKLQHICHDNGLKYDVAKTSDGLTKVTLTFSLNQTRASNDNIVTLFKKHI